MEMRERGTVPQKIKGCRDIDPELNRLRWHVIRKAEEVYRRYGFAQWDTPVMEFADCLGKYLPDADSVAEGVYSFRNPEEEPVLDRLGNRITDQDGNFIMENHFLSLRYDLTAPLSRLYAERLWSPQLIKSNQPMKPPLFRRYQFGPVFRYEAKLDPGRFREFWQLDFDSVGAEDPASDAEVCMVLSDALEAIGLKPDTFRVKLNSRKILKGFLQIAGIVDEAQEQSVLRVIDKGDKIGWEGVRAELGAGRKDTSGAMISGMGLSSSTVETILSFLNASVAQSKRSEILDSLNAKYTSNETFREGIAELRSIDALLTAAGYGDDNVIVDPSLVRGMIYYTGAVFEVESLLTYLDEKGKTRRVGSICGGGRYDGLVERLLGIRVPATGASIGVDRLCELLTLTKTLTLAHQGPVLIVVFDAAMMNEYQSIARELRAAGIPAEVYYGINKGLKKQLAYADEIKSPAAILLGEDELRKGVVTVRNLKLGAQISASIADKDEWKKKAQQEIPRSELIAHIKSLLE